MPNGSTASGSAWTRGGPTGSGTSWTAGSEDNDRAADAYVRKDFSGDDSVVDLTALAEALPSAARRAPAKKEAVKKVAPAQTAKKAAPAAKRAGKTAR